ncbi:DUF7134 domain-containing protein [Dactylosporangium sp. McL0621]|uniref:DUF7134 domain-containing protein n=1 Tax=Dactylosporangium sp. McL0621 TaxID=3415678 RepID=UPI003CECCADB
MADVFGGRIRDLGRRHPAVRDAAPAVAVLLSGVVANPAGDAGGDRLALWWAAGGLLAAAVALRTRWPLSMLTVGTFAASVHLGLLLPLLLVDLGVPVLLYTVATRYGWAVSLAVLGAMLLLSLSSSRFAGSEGAVWSAPRAVGGRRLAAATGPRRAAGAAGAGAGGGRRGTAADRRRPGAAAVHCGPVGLPDRAC